MDQVTDISLINEFIPCKGSLVRFKQFVYCLLSTYFYGVSVAFMFRK